MITNKEPLVSIIMNCYNGEKYLKEAIESIFTQTYDNWEIIFWDNCSSDGSAEIFKGYNDKRLKYFQSKNKTNLNVARNCAIDQASGMLLSFLDVDDWWCADKLERQVPLFRNDNISIVYGNYFFFNEIKNTKHLMSKNILPTGKIIKEILDGDISIGLVTLIIRRISLQSLKIGFDPQYHIIGDFDVVVRIALKGGQVACEQGPVGYYRWHGSNESIKNKRLQLKETESWLSDMGKTIDNHLLVKFRQKLSYNKAQFYLEDKRYLSFFLSLKGVGFSKELLKVLFLLFLLFFPRTSQKIRKI